MRLTAVVGGVISLIVAFWIVTWLAQATVTISQPPEPQPDPATDVFPTNPFTKPTTGSFAKASVDNNEFDFGVAQVRDDSAEGSSGSHGFVITNTGNAPLKLAKGPTGCKCTMSQLATVEIPPGESTTITLEWKPTIADDAFYKEAVIWTNDPSLFEGDDPKDGRLVLKIKGKAVAGVQLDPNMLSLGIIDETKPTPIETTIFSKLRDDLDVQVKSISSQYIKAELKPLTEEELKTHDAKSGFKLTGALEPKVPIGRIRESLVLTTSDDLQKELTLSIEAQRQGPFSIAGKYFSPAFVFIDFRQIDADKGMETTLSLYAQKTDPPLELEVVSKSPEFLEATVERDPEFPEEERTRHLIKVRVPGGQPPQRRVARDSGEVKFRTNHSEVPEFSIHVSFESR